MDNLIDKAKKGLRQYFRVFVLGLSLVIGDDLSAQWDMGGSVDTAKIDSSSLKKIPYVRFVPPYDTMREIIFYEGVIENEDCQLCTADSLYWRAKKYLSKKYGKAVLKKMILHIHGYILP